MDMGLKIIMALMMGFFIWRMWPAAKHHFKHGEKGSSSDWLTYALLMAGVALFVVVLMAIV